MNKINVISKISQVILFGNSLLESVEDVRLQLRELPQSFPILEYNHGRLVVFPTPTGLRLGYRLVHFFILIIVL